MRYGIEEEKSLKSMTPLLLRTQTEFLRMSDHQLAQAVLFRLSDHHILGLIFAKKLKILVTLIPL